MNESNFSLQASVVQPLMTLHQSRARSRPQSNSQWIKKVKLNCSCSVNY